MRALAANPPANTAFTFQTLPTLWGTAGGLDYSSFDLVVHLGLGVYDRHDRLVLEHGARNERSSSLDASQAAAASGRLLEAAAPATLHAGEPMRTKLDRLTDAGRPPLPHGFELVVLRARAANTYICNETHHRALRAVEAGAGPSAAYFMHIPYAAKDDSEHERLGAAVAALVVRMVEEERGGLADGWHEAILRAHARAATDFEIPEGKAAL